MKNNDRKNKMKNSDRKNKQWLRNPNQRKHMKLFTVNMVQLPSGKFHLIGGGTQVAVKKNQHGAKSYNVDVRDLATEIRLNGVTSF
jgi:hypothetical protein